MVSGSPVLEVRNLTKQFPGVLALDGVAFVLGLGEIHALVGQNGAGKSTMINILSGMLAPDAGEIRLAGRPASIDSTRKAIELGIATVYQELSLLPNLTVAQNIVLGHEPRRLGLLDVAAMRAAARKALARIGVEIADDTPVGLLSLAERQLVEWKKVKFMIDRVGDEFSALIISTTRFGFFVELDVPYRTPGGVRV